MVIQTRVSKIERLQINNADGFSRQSDFGGTVGGKALVSQAPDSILAGGHGPSMQCVSSSSGR
jgi:hypothetical protein